MGAYSKIAVVTGANKGIGLAIVRNLALQYPNSSMNSGPLLVHLTARSSARGEEAVKTILSDPQLIAAKALSQDGGLTTITFNSLDIDDETSIEKFKELIKSEHPDGIDILINNAGIALEGFNVDVVKATLKTNYYGTLAMTQEFLPLIRPKGRLVNVASSSGVLIPYSESLKKALTDAAKTSVNACTDMMEKFTADVQANNHKAEGWPSSAYAVSKAGEIAFTKAIAMEHEQSGGTVLVNVCDPGYTNTDMSKGKGPLTVDEGASTPVFLGLGEFGGQSGGFWKLENIIEWCPTLGI